MDKIKERFIRKVHNLSSLDRQLKIEKAFPYLFNINIGDWVVIKSTNIDKFSNNMLHGKIGRVIDLDKVPLHYFPYLVYMEESEKGQQKVWSNVRKATEEEIYDYLVKRKENLGFKYGKTFTAIRDTFGTDYTEGQSKYKIGKNIAYSREVAQIGNSFIYKPETDTLYTVGFGRYVLYEKGKWPTLKI